MIRATPIVNDDANEANEDDMPTCTPQREVRAMFDNDKNEYKKKEIIPPPLNSSKVSENLAALDR